MTEWESKIVISYNDRAVEGKCPVCGKITMKITPLFINYEGNPLCGSCAKLKTPLMVDMMVLYMKKAMKQGGISNN